MLRWITICARCSGTIVYAKHRELVVLLLFRLYHVLCFVWRVCAFYSAGEKYLSYERAARMFLYVVGSCPLSSTLVERMGLASVGTWKICSVQTRTHTREHRARPDIEDTTAARRKTTTLRTENDQQSTSNLVSGFG